MNNQKPWLQWVGEGLVIVASILLAFGIQAWWEDRKEGEEEHRMLAALLEEARGNAEWLDRMASYYENGIFAAHAIQEAAAQAPTLVSADSLDALISTLTGTFSPPLERGALDAILTGGRIDVISDDDLRSRIAAWERGFRVADAQAEADVRIDESRWQPVLLRLASLSQIAARASEDVAPGLELPDRLRGYGEPPIGESTDHRTLLREREFLNAVQLKRWVYEDALYNHSSFTVPQLDAMIEAIEIWLGSSG